MNRILNIFLLILLCSNTPLAFPQEREEGMENKKVEVSGFVTNLSGDPVKGAILILDEQETPAKTNRKGYYKIKVNSGIKTIAVYKKSEGAAEIVFEGQENQNFTLNPDLLSKYDRTNNAKKVDIGYQEVDDDYTTSNASVIDNSDKRKSHYSTIYEMIRGEVPGVTVSGNSVVIRGVTTISRSTAPLFVVDGIYMNDVSSIHPEMVQSITVLKGADASIYGVQGANGVIIIKTRTRMP